MHYNCLLVDDEIELAEMTCEYFNMFDTIIVAAYIERNQHVIVTLPCADKKYGHIRPLPQPPAERKAALLGQIDIAAQDV